MTSQLCIAGGLSLPLDAVTQTFGILAKRGAGKTYTGAVIAEEMIGAGAHVAIIDPLGVWWGLRASADGKSAGLPIVVLGGDHGDLPLEVGAGDLVADLVVDEGVSVVVDLSHFRKGEQTRFMQAFAERLYHRNREPLHLFLDEADAFAPQRPMPGQQRLLGAVEDLVRRGRARGLGVTLITQRSAVLNKDVLTQAEVLIALRTVAPQDREAVDAWVRVHGTPEQRAEMMASLPSLPIGNAWIWSPGWLDIFQRVQIRHRSTFDSSATPKVGQKPLAPKVLADVDLAALRERMAATIERAKADDPRSLRDEILALRRQLADRSAPEVRVERVEVPVVADAQLDRLESRADDLLGMAKDLEVFGREILAVVSAARPRQVEQRAVQAPVQARITPAAPALSRAVAKPIDDRVTVPQQRILDALAWWEAVGVAAPTRLQLGFAADYRASGGAFGNYLGQLRTAGLLDYPAQGVVAFTESGRAIARPTAMDRTRAALHALVLASLPKPQARILECLIGEWPGQLDREEIAQRTGMAASGGAFGNYLGALRTLGLSTYPTRGWARASDLLFPEGLP